MRKTTIVNSSSKDNEDLLIEHDSQGLAKGVLKPGEMAEYEYAVPEGRYEYNISSVEENTPTDHVVNSTTRSMQVVTGWVDKNPTLASSAPTDFSSVPAALLWILKLTESSPYDGWSSAHLNTFKNALYVAVGIHELN